MTNTPWLQEPYYEQTPMTGNAIMAWILGHPGVPYIDNTGNAFLLGPNVGGTWVDDPSAPVIPQCNTQGQRFAPTDPTLLIWQAGTMYGKDGYDLWVQSDLCKQIIAEIHANPEPIPEAIANPPPPVYAPPPHQVAPPMPPEFMGWFRRFMGRF